jgi:outer membrane protein assembly factor BamB
MNNLDRQNTDFADNEHIQISDLDGKADQKRLAHRIITTAHKAVKTPWIRYSMLGSLLFILLGAIFLQTHQPAPATSPPPISNQAGVAPSVHGPTLALGDDQIYVLASDGTLTAKQGENGRVLWHQKLSGQASLLASGQVVFAYYATTADNGTLEALNGNNGHILWHYALARPGTTLALQQTGETLYVADYYDTISAFQTDNGRLRWTYHDGPGQTLPVFSLVEEQNGIAEIFETNNTMDLLHAADGRKILHIQPDANNNLPQVTIDGQLIYELPNIGGLPVKQPVQVFRASDGKLLWSWTLQHTSPDVSITEQDGVLYRGDNHSSLAALRGSDGHPLWTYKVGNAANGIVSSDLEETGSVYLTLQDGTVIRLRASDGLPIWSTRMEIANQFIYPPDFLLESGMIFLYYSNNPSGGTTSEKNQVYVLRASDGKILWHPPGFSWQPWIQSGMLYTVQSGGRVDAWQESDGMHLWSCQALAGMSVYGNPAGNHNLVILTDEQGNIEVLRASDGKLLWHSQEK